jgi:hypothetical protein
MNAKKRKLQQFLRKEAKKWWRRRELKPIEHFANLRRISQCIAWMSLTALSKFAHIAAKRSFGQLRAEILSRIVPKPSSVDRSRRKLPGSAEP